MSTTFCQKCQAEHPGRECDYKDGECAETVPELVTSEIKPAESKDEKSKV